MQDVVIIGGGLAGLICANQLAKAGLSVTLLEKKIYPFHRVCGEYISNEVVPFLEREQLFPAESELPKMNELFLTALSGRSFSCALPLGGFGISRFTFDHFLARKAAQNGAEILTGTNATEIQYEANTDSFRVKTLTGQTIVARLAIGSFGKRSALDRYLQRPFFVQRSPYIGVKYHVKAGLPKNQIALHNFKDGYCGVAAIENDRFNICYLTTRANLKHYGTIPELEKNVLHKNPFLKNIFSDSEFLYPQPEVINEITFAPKSLIENHILMCGDAAGMITPLCGNGMAMAIHSAAILSELVRVYFSQNGTRQQLEKAYSQTWNGHFSGRLRTGRQVQQLFGKPILSEIAIGALRQINGLSRLIIPKTHGIEF